MPLCELPPPGSASLPPSSPDPPHAPHVSCTGSILQVAAILAAAGDHRGATPAHLIIDAAAGLALLHHDANHERIAAVTGAAAHSSTSCRLDFVETTTIRVDVDTHARLLEMSRQTGATLIETVRAAAEALHRQRFAHRVAGELDRLRSDPEAWRDYLGEAEATSVTDGVDR